jgi:hypothetical protein
MGFNSAFRGLKPLTDIFKSRHTTRAGNELDKVLKDNFADKIRLSATVDVVAPNQHTFESRLLMTSFDHIRN